MTQTTSLEETDLAVLRRRVQQLEALEAIRDLKARYSRLADRAMTARSAEAVDAVAELFVEDASASYGPYGSFRGRAEVRRAFEAVLPVGFRWSSHHFTDSRVEVRGDEAEGEWRFMAHVQPDSPAGAPIVTFYGTSRERYRRTGEGWLFSAIDVEFSAPPP
ncbi:MAG: nuclear transport factor 2 family protein [Phycisphaerales bacterium]|nr:nuclear transport factor 2 family protein [Polyangiaceae bacterium]NUQ68786.1 nuclear transport factor 2 family protein [Phycisphaerales bacterium]